MCTVSVKVNEELLQNMRPDLDSTAAISLWVQELVNQHLQQMELEDTETMSIEEARTLTHAAIRDEYAKV